MAPVSIMQIAKLPLKQIQASSTEYTHLGEQLVGMSQPFHQEVVATAGQQLFTVSKPFTTGTNQLKVFVNGVLQKAGETGGYVEMSNTTIMFTEPLTEGDVVVFRIEGAGSGFVPLNGGGGLLSPAEVKALYESNPNTNAFTDEEKVKLASVEYGANKHVHPATHPADMIVEDENHRFVTDAEKELWNTLAGIDYVPVNKAGDTIEGNLGVNGDITVTGSILPAVNSAQDIGSPTRRFKNIYVDEAHLSVSTLYIGSTPILGTEEAKINFQADPNQTIDIKTTGIGEARMSSEKVVEIYTPETTSADILIHADGSGADVMISAAGQIGIDAPSISISGDVSATGTMTIGDLVVNGNASFQGTVMQVNTEVISTSDTTITLNSGEQGAGVTAGVSGIEVDRGTLPDARFLFDESDDQFKIGVGSDLQVIATRPWAEANFTPLSHHGANGSVHAVATQSLAGFMSAQDKTKLDGIEPNANYYVHPQTKQCSYQYVHPTGDGNLHVPATGTGNAGKVLKAGGAAGSLSWAFVNWDEINGRPSLATNAAAGLMAAIDKAKLDTVAANAEPNQNAFSNIKIGTAVIQAANKTDTFELVAGPGISFVVDQAGKKITITATGGSGGGSVRRYRVIPSGVVDGTNAIFTLPEDIADDSEEVFVNGLLMDKGADNDYTISGRVIVFNTPVPANSKIRVNYTPS